MAHWYGDHQSKPVTLATILVFLGWIVGRCHAQQAAGVTCNAGDSTALLEFKAGVSLKSGQENEFESWVLGTDCCIWFAVSCTTTGRVQTLGRLSSSGAVTETGAAALSRLEDLESIVIWYLVFNNQSIPKAWGQLRKLTVLSLYSCQFSGPIPKEIGGMSSLQTLSLQPPPEGPIPNEMCELTNIEVVDINPGLTGHLPLCIYKWKKVQKITLQGNNLTGLLPPSLGTLSTLTSLYLNDNNFYGPIPFTIGGLQSLQYLNMVNNQLSGPLPKELGKLQSLQTMELTNNKIWGTIPPEIGNMSSLWLLDISFNHLWGGLPDSIGRMPELVRIELSHNNLYGTLPPSLGFAPKLFNLHLDSNRFWGRIPVSIINNASDIVLDNNYFSGPLPYDGILFDGLEKDGLLSVANNRLTGGVPLYVMTRFYVNLSHNRLSVSRAIGTLPTPHFEGVISLYLSHNNFSGPIPSWVFIGRTRLETLDISFNKFSGVLPEGLFDLPRILVLDASSNQLSSHLPETPFSNVSKYFFQYTTSLNLSHNSIEGGISASFFAGVSNYTAFLDLSDNQLSGTLQGIDNLTARTTRYLDFSTNHLTGSIPGSIGSLVNLEHLDLSNNELSGTIPASIAALPILTYENFSGNANLTGA